MFNYSSIYDRDIYFSDLHSSRYQRKSRISPIKVLAVGVGAAALLSRSGKPMPSFVKNGFDKFSTKFPNLGAMFSGLYKAGKSIVDSIVNSGIVNKLNSSISKIGSKILSIFKNIK